MMGDVDSGPAWWRCQMPFQFLQRRGVNCVWGDTHDMDLPAELPLYDIFIMYRAYFPTRTALRGWMDLCRNHNKLVFFDTDDDYVSSIAYAKHGHDESSNRKFDEGRRPYLDMANAADGITVSTPHLGGVMERHTRRPISIIPNLLDLDWWDFVAGKSKRLTPSDKVVVGWLGGRRNPLDWAEMIPAWTWLADEYPQAHFVIAGHDEKRWDLVDLLAAVPEDRLTLLPWTSINVYPMHFMSIDIGCCPLGASAFNWSKSPIKAVEYAASRIPVVASPTVYSTGFKSARIARNTEEWKTHLAELVESESLRKEEGERAREDVYYNHSLQFNWLKVISGWQNLIDHASGPRVLTPGEAVGIVSPVLP